MFTSFTDVTYPIDELSETYARAITWTASHTSRHLKLATVFIEEHLFLVMS